MPRAAPWQLPALQPAFMNTGITSSLKLIGGSTAACFTLIGTSALSDSNVDGELRIAIGLRQQVDSPLAQRRSSRSSFQVALSVTSRVMPFGIFRLNDDRLRIASGRQRDLAGIHVQRRLALRAARVMRRQQRAKSAQRQPRRLDRMNIVHGFFSAG